MSHTLYWVLPRYRSKRSISSIMMTCDDRVRKKILCTSTLSHLLIKLRAIKMDILVSKEPLWADQIMSVPYVSAVRNNMSIKVRMCPIFLIGIIGKYKRKSRIWPLERPPKVLQICKTIKFTCSLIRSLITSTLWVIWTLFMRDVWILKFPR